MDTARSETPRSNFIGRIQEQRQFRTVLEDWLNHYRRWRDWSDQAGTVFEPGQAPRDDSYTRILLLHGIGGIGKSWLARRCLNLAQAEAPDAQILTLYDDISLGAPVLEPVELLDRLHRQLTQAGYESQLIPYRQTQADLAQLTEQITRYRLENRLTWEALLQTAANQVTREAATGPVGVRSTQDQASTLVLATANDLLLDHLEQAGQLNAGQVALLRQPVTVQAARLRDGLQQLLRQHPLIIALDNLEIVVPLEPFIRDQLVLPTVDWPLLWILSGRHNLADERVVEIGGREQVHKGYRDLLGENPPLVWDMSTFGDADLREFLDAEAQRRLSPLNIDDNLIAAVKATSSGVPLVVEMVADALFTLDREEFLQNFVLDDKTLLPANRLEQITARFLRYCLTQEDDLERVQTLALLRRGATEPALRAVWALPPAQNVGPVLSGLEMRYAFVQADGLHDAVYEFVRRQLHTLKKQTGVRARLSRRAVEFYRAGWEQLQASQVDPAGLLDSPAWTEATRDLLNALLWADPDEAMAFFLPRFVEGLGFARPLAEELLLQFEEFLAADDRANALNYFNANLLPRLRAGLKDVGWVFNEPGQGVEQMVKALLVRPGWEPLHVCLLNLWHGHWLAGQNRYDDALGAYTTAVDNLPSTAATLREQVGQAFYELSGHLLWPEHPADPVPSESGLLAARQSVELLPELGSAWYNLGIALEYLERESEAVSAYQRAVELEPRASHYTSLGDAYAALHDYDPAIAAYRQAIQLEPPLPWPYHGLAIVYSDLGEYETALPLYLQAIERHTRGRDAAASWDGLGDVQTALGHYEDALEAYRQVIKLTPHESLPWYSLGNVYAALGRDDEAIEPYRRAIELDASYPWAYHNLGLVYERRGDTTLALVLFQQAIERQRNDDGRAISWNSLGDVYSALDRHEEAAAAYRQAIVLAPGLVEAHGSLGREYARLERYEAAAAAYHQALDLMPDDALLWYRLANVCSALKQYDEAISAYQRAIELEPDAAWPYNNLGFVFQKLGRYEQALECYRQALDRHQDGYSQAVSWDNLGNVYTTLGNVEEASFAYRRAQTLAPTYAWPYHNLADAHTAQGDYQAAVTLYQQAIERHESDQDRATSWNKLGDAYHALGQLEEAINAYQRVIELNPQQALPWFSLGNVYRSLAGQQERDRTVQIIDAYRRAIELDPDFAWPYHQLGQIYQQRGDTDTALRLYQQALERHVNDRDRAQSWGQMGDIYRALGQLPAAIDAYRRAIDLDPAYAWPYHHLAEMYQEQAEYETALPLYQRAIACHTEAQPQARAWNHLGDVYRALNRPKEAVSAYRQAIELDGDYALPWNSVGDLCRLLNRPAEAIDAYRRAIELDPDFAQPYHSLAQSYSQQGDQIDHEAAITLYRQAIERYESTQDRARAWNDLGRTYRALGRLESAIKAFRRAIELDDRYLAPWHNLGDVYRTLSYADDAVEAYRQAIALDPADAVSWNNLGDVYRTHDRADEAIEAYREAIKLEATYAWPYHSLGLIYEHRQDYDSAISFFQQATEWHERAHDQAVAWQHLGDIYRQLERFDEATAAYRQAIDLDPAYAWPYHNLGLVSQAQGDDEAAVLYYRQAIERHHNDRDRVISWHSLGDICHTLNRHEEAIAAYQQVIDLDPDNARPWNSLGTAYTALEHYEAAIKAFEQAIELDPDYAWPYHNLGYVYEKREEYEAAIPYYRQAIERHQVDPETAVSWNNLGNAYHALERNEEAVQAYQKAIELNPAYALPWDSLGDVYRLLDRHQEATRAYRRAIELDPDYAWPYHNLGLVRKELDQPEQAVPLFQQAIERHRNNQDRAISWNNLGNAYQSLGRRDEAIHAYHQAIELDPAYAWSYNNLGVVQAGHGAYELAIKLYHQAIEHHQEAKNKAVSWDNLGNVLAAQGHLEAALEAYRQAIELDPTYALPQNSAGNVLLAQGQPAKAADAYQQATKLDPGFALPWNGWGDAYQALGRPNEAIDAYRRAIELDPDYAWPYHHLGTIYEQRREYEPAIKYYRQAIERHEHDGPKAVLWYNLGNVYRALEPTAVADTSDWTKQALEAYRQAIALDPDYALPWYRLANLFVALGSYEEAIEAYRRAIGLDPTDGWFYHHLGVVYEKLKQREQAVEAYRQAIARHKTEVDLATTWHNLGRVYHQWGHYDEAIAALGQAIKLHRTSARPWNSLGDVYSELNDHRQTIRAYRRAIELDPKFARPYNNLGFVYEQLGEYEQAIKLYRHVVDHHQADEERAVAWNNLGNVYRAQEQYEPAIEAYRQAIKLDPDYTWPYHNLGAIYESRGDYEEALALYQQATQQHRAEAV